MSYYFLGRLEYAYKETGGAWVATTVDSSEYYTGKYPSLAVDESGAVHIAYHDFDWTTGSLKYAHKEPSRSWNTFTVDTGTNLGSHPSLAIDGVGGIHVSYYDETNGRLNYAFKALSATWTTGFIDGNESYPCGAYSSLAVDGSNGVHISYYQGQGAGGKELKFAYKEAGGSWTTATVESGGGTFTSLAVDGFGGIHVSYHYDSSGESVWYAHKPPGGDWATTVIDSGLLGVRSTSLALDSSGGIHVTYYDFPTKSLKYARYPCGS